MKRIAMAIMMASMLAMPGNTLAQKHRHTPRTETTADAPAASDTTGIEAYSDTTWVDNGGSAGQGNGAGWDDGTDDEDETLTTDDLRELRNLFGLTFGTGVAATVIVIVMGIIAVFPFLSIALIVWLLVRNRNRRYRLAEKAMENGQPIPDQLIEPDRGDMWQKGIRNICLGIGIAVLCYCLGADSLAGIGWLVAICGAGQAFIGKTSAKKKNDIEKY